MRKKLLVIVSVMFLLCSCGANKEALAPVDDDAQHIVNIASEPVVVKISAVGDNLVHNTLSFDSKTNDGYNFYPIYSGVESVIKNSDVAIINEEVPLNGEVGAYPLLAAPKEVASALKEVGFNVATLANNHMADKGSDGIVKTIEAFRENDFLAIAGASEDCDYADKGTAFEVNGIKIGIASYTYGLNTYAKEGYVNIINKDKIIRDIEPLRSECDLLIVAMHWGNEYDKNVSDYEKEYAQLLSNLGVDLILGAHPHVVQECAWLTGVGGNKTLCAYSLGNFVSNQHGVDNMLGGLLSVDATFVDGSFMGFENVEYNGVVTQFNSNSRNFKTYLLSDYTEELASEHGLKKYNKVVSLDYFKKVENEMRQSLVVNEQN